ncbi:hypothetical protein [Dysgonomonas sp. GY617]|uniref:hypothetical protein n=1 Tax=Dysgonomonas sp. GY617 TaxID=2780420 RepID=UPI00188436B0|nr:hypothetical protein [Dysgonomonas sp. GY617]MBF0577740.1 hypothetical protein [Dysgonomonas sp. GY617]
MKLTIRAIIRWEQLNQKPFSKLDYGNIDDIVSFFYTCSLSDEVNISLEEFKKDISDKGMEEMSNEFERQTYLASQFQPIHTTKEKEDSSDERNNSEPIYIKDIVSSLVMNGLDVHFALNEMQIYELPIFLNAHDQRVKNRLESERLWTFIQISPHLSKKIKSPKDIYPFSWEIEADKEISEEELKKGREIFKVFTQSRNK